LRPIIQISIESLHMRIILITGLSTALMILLSAFPASAFTWGVVGHKVWNHAVWNDPEAEFATLERYGLKTYRFDMPLIDTQPQAADTLQKLITLAQTHHITLHPILYVPFTWDDATDSGKYPNTEAGLEMQGYNRVYPFVLKFASQIHDWELQNEIDLKKGVKSGSGRSVNDYNTLKAKQWAAVLRGMSKAISDVQQKTGQPVKTVVDMVDTDFGFVPFLETNGVQVDKLAYHYYRRGADNPHKIKVSDGTVDIFSELGKLGKPVIINEFNAGEIYAPKYEHKPYDDAKALASLKKHLDYITGQKEAHIEGIEYYELYNEPWKDVAESNFGLMKDATHARTQMLLAAVYACGKLSEEEKGVLVSSGLFTDTALSEKLKSCRK